MECLKELMLACKENGRALNVPKFVSVHCENDPLVDFIALL